MKREYTLVEDIIREEVMIDQIINRQVHSLLKEQYLVEGKLDLAKNFMKIWDIANSINGGGKTLKKILTLINKVDLSLLPSLLTKGVKWVPNTEKTAKVISLYKNNKTNVKASENMATFVIGTGQDIYCVEDNDRIFINLLCEFFTNVYSLIKSFIGMIPGGGTVVVLVLDLIESIVVHLQEAFKTEWDRVWAIAKTFFKKQVPFTIDDLKQAWNIVKEKGYSTFYYGGRTGNAYKDALSYLKKARAALNNTRKSDLTYKMKLIASVYRKRLATQSEINKTIKFCDDILKLNIPTYDQAMKMWPGIKRVDDGTYARHILEAFPWKVLSNDGKSVAGWFSKSCKVASKSFAELEKDIDNIGKPKVKNNPSYSNAHPRGGMYR